MRVYSHLFAYPPIRLLGGELMTSVLLSALAQRGHEVKVATITQVEPFTNGGVRVVPNMVDLLSHQEAAPDVFVTHPELAEFNYDRARGYGSRMVAIVHNLEPRTVSALQDFRWDAVVANGRETQAALALAGIDSVVVRPPTRFLPPPRVTMPRRYITLVNLATTKGGETFWQLAERMPDHDFLGIIGGYGGQVLRDPVPENVVVTSSTVGMGMMLALSRVVIMPSEKETWGMVGCEALAAGVPVIATDLPGPREALDSGGCFIADPHDVDAWEAALRELDDPALYEAAGLEALVRGGELLEQTERDLDAWVALIEGLR